MRKTGLGRRGPRKNTTPGVEHFIPTGIEGRFGMKGHPAQAKATKTRGQAGLGVRGRRERETNNFFKRTPDHRVKGLSYVAPMRDRGRTHEVSGPY